MTMSRDNSNTLQATGVFTTLKALNRLILQQIEEREAQRVVNRDAMNAMSQRFMGDLNRPLFTIAASDYYQKNKVRPDAAQLFKFILDNKSY